MKTVITTDSNLSCVCSDDTGCNICGGTGSLAVLVGRKYRHHKGDAYEILGVVTDANDGTPVVLYARACASAGLQALRAVYAHRLTNFFSQVRPGVMRFTHINGTDNAVNAAQ